MVDTSTDKIIKDMCDATIESLKKLAAEGKKLDQKSLYEKINLNKNFIQTIHSYKSNEQREPQEDSSDVQSLSNKFKDEVSGLKKDLEKVSTKKNKLMGQFREMEDDFDNKKEFYEKTLMVLSDLLRDTKNKTLSFEIKQFKTLVIKKAGTEQLNKSFQNIKNAALLETVDDEEDGSKASKGKKLGFLGKWIRNEEDTDDKKGIEFDYFLRFQETYQDIIDELKRALSSNFLDKLKKFETRIKKADTVDDFISLRKDVLNLLQDYIAGVSTDRESAAIFIKEIGQKIIDVEKFIMDSYLSMTDGYNANSSFHNFLETNINELKGNIDFSKTLDEMRNEVVIKLNVITKAIQEKKQIDSVAQKTTDKKIAAMKQNLGKMKKGIIFANKKAKLLEGELNVDSLTGANNRRAYDKRLNEEMERFTRYQRPFSLVILDIDHFKKVNDNYGHAIGDKCLKEIIGKVKPLLRKIDMLARIGGEEFAVILSETGIDAAVLVAEKLRKAIEKIEFMHKKDKVKITISLGVTEVKSLDKTGKTIFERADFALYEAKNSGRNRVEKKI